MEETKTIERSFSFIEIILNPGGYVEMEYQDGQRGAENGDAQR
jgi:hypothetical protein